MKTKLLACLLLCMVTLGIGCGTEQERKRQCLNTQKTFTAVVEGLTIYKDKFSPEEVYEISIIIHKGQDCLNQWNESFKDPNALEVDWFACVNEMIIELILYQEKAKGVID